MAKTPSRPVKQKENLRESIACLGQRIQEFDDLLSGHGSKDAVREFDEGTELVLSDMFGNPSEVLEAYAYAQLGEAAGWINLPEEAQLEGDQDVWALSLKQRKGVLEQGLAELKAKQGKRGK